MFDTHCGACGIGLQHPAWSPWPRVRRAARRALRAAVLTSLLVVAPTVLLLHRYARRAEVEPWEIGVRIDLLAASDPPDWQEVRVLARQLVDRGAKSARAWYLLALSGRRLGYSPRLAVREATRAVRLDPTMGEAQLFLAVELARLGELDAAREHVRHAMEWDFAPPETWVLAGELELSRVRPDVERALAFFETARRRGHESVELDVRVALLRQQLVGVVAPERYPPELAVALRRARAALEREGADDVPAGLREWFAAELALADGHLEEARETVERGLRLAAPDGADPRVRARLLISRGRVELARGQDDAAGAAFGQALAASSDAETAGTVQGALAAAGRADLARRVLAGVPAEQDPSGAVRAALAETARREGRLDDARTLARAARASAPRSPERAVLLGDVLRDRGDLDGARAAYEDAVATGHDTLSARLRIALLPVAAGGSVDPAQAEAAVAAVRALADDAPEDPEVDHALGRALLAAGRPGDAVLAFERVLRAMPWSADAWLDLSEAWRRASTPGALTRSAECASEAARMRPFDRDVVLAVARAAARNGDDAMVVLTTTIYLDRSPGDSAVLRRRAEARMRLDDWGGAAADLEAVRTLGDDALVVRLQLADAFARAGRDAEAWALVRAAPDATERRALEVVLAAHDTRVPRGASFSSPVAVAVRHVRGGDLEKGIAVLRAAREETPRDPAVVRALVLLLCGEGGGAVVSSERLAEARSAVDALGESAGAGVPALLRGRIALAEREPQRAVELLHAAVEALPWDPGARFWQGEALLAAGDGAGAREALSRATWLPGGRATFGRHIAVRLFALSEGLSEAERESALRDALRADAAHTPAVQRLADLLLARGAHREAAEVAERGIAALQAAGRPPAADEIALRHRALAARIETGDAELAGRHLDALERIGGSVERPDTVRGLIALGRDRGDQAERAFRAALGTDDGDRLAALGMVEALIRRGAADAAFAFVRARLDERPDELALGHVAVRSLVRSGRVEAALRVTEDLVARAPLDASTVRQRVWALGLVGHGDEALAVARGAAARARADASEAIRGEAARFEVLGAECLLQLAGRAPEALAEARRLGADPAASGAARRDARLVEAECLVQLGSIDEAEAALRGLTVGWNEGRPTTPLAAATESRILFVDGMVAVLRGRSDEAAAAFLRAVELDPVHHAAANNAAWCVAQSNPSSAIALDLARRATAAVPGNATYWDTRALCERGGGDWDAALRSWERSADLLAARGAPADELAPVLLRRAELLLDMGRDGEARAVAERILALSPEPSEAERARRITELP